MLWTTFPGLSPDCGTPRSSVAPYYHGQGPVTDLVVSGSSPRTKLPFLDNNSASYALGPWPQWTSVSCCPHPCLCPALFLLPGGDPRPDPPVLLRERRTLCTRAGGEEESDDRPI